MLQSPGRQRWTEMESKGGQLMGATEMAREQGVTCASGVRMQMLPAWDTQRNESPACNRTTKTLLA